MVLGFGSKSAKKKGRGDENQQHVVRMASLPEMSSQGVAWPSEFVDITSIRQNPPQTPTPHGAAKVSFSAPEGNVAIPFHRPFRGSISSRPAPGREEVRSTGTIASLYMSKPAYPPSAFGTKPSERASTPHSTRTRHSHSQRKRVAPTFNLMVAGAQGTGKSSLLRLLVDTADISPSATAEQRAAMDRFIRSSMKRTEHIDTACVEICESRFDRILLSVIDTPGLDFQEGHELKLERQVSGIIKYLDLQYADTMDEESKVVRKSKGDQHVHLCIYMIDPESLMTPAERKAATSTPFPMRISSVEDTDASEADEDRLTMSPTDLRIIRRLSERVNILPIIARSDLLTDEKLRAAKMAIRRDLVGAKLGFGVFGTPKVEEEVNGTARHASVEESHERNGRMNGNGNGNGNRNGSGSQTDEGFGGEESEEEERRSRPIIKLNPNRRLSTRSTSRSRLEASAEDKRNPIPLDATDPESLAYVRFSAGYFARHVRQFSEMMPFAVIMPEHTGRMRRALKAPPPLRPVSGTYSMESSAYPQTPVTQNGGDSSADSGNVSASDDAFEKGSATPTTVTSPATLKSPSVDHLPYAVGPPRDLKGVFTRQFRWGTVDVLEPEHCDFAALRTAILTTHFKVLKMTTKEVLYEKYRTEKLLARRATRNISDEDRKRLLEDLGL
ncbi:hypothetical protein ACEPAG_1455 [Sanghuangporus baumii]